MVDQIITKQGLINASKDANTLEECINGPANKKVRSRLGGHYWTLATVGSIVEETKTETSEFLNDLATRYLALSLKGDWQAATAYVVKDLVFVENITYICLVGHTSSSSFQSDLSNGKWFVYQGATQVDLQNYLPKTADFPPSPHLPTPGSPIRFKLNPIKASMLYGINDPTHLDDNLNIFRGLNNPNAWHESNISVGTVAFGRNNVPFAYLSMALGHDCVAYGVASITMGAGSCTGNPDVPSDGANYGYCSLAVGKDTQARGRISNAMGYLNLSESRYSSTDGYKCVAGKVLPTHPDYEIHGDDGAEGAAARAHGYKAEAYGNFAFSYGSFLTAYNGAQVIGKGINDGSPLSVSKRGIGIGYNVDIPTIFCQAGPGVNGAHAWVGFNTEEPLSKYDFRLGQSDTVTHIIDATAGENTLTANEIKGKLGDGSFASLHNIIVTHPNAGQAYATVQYRLNGTEYMTIDPSRKVTFKGAVEAGSAGFVVAGKRVVGGQLPAITNDSGSNTSEKVNEILAALRAHGLIAT